MGNICSGLRHHQPSYGNENPLAQIIESALEKDLHRGPYVNESDVEYSVKFRSQSSENSAINSQPAPYLTEYAAEKIHDFAAKPLPQPWQMFNKNFHSEKEKRK
jgi:hypothetical protein